MNREAHCADAVMAEIYLLTCLQQTGFFSFYRKHKKVQNTFDTATNNKLMKTYLEQ